MGIYRLARFVAGLSFILVIAGGLVTSTGSGLAVPDWPLSYGTLFPPMVGGIRFEHSHRLIAAAVGLLTLALTLVILFKEKRRWVRRLALGAFGLVVGQGILGGLTVLWQLPAPVSIGHACMGQTFFATICVLAAVLNPGWHPKTWLSPLTVLTTAAIYLQLILGASLRHIGWSPVLLTAHLVGAITASVLILRLANVDRGARRLRWLLFIQLGLGILTFLRGADLFTATAHVATGALLLAASAVLTVTVSRTSTRATVSTYLELAKPRLTALAVLASLMGGGIASRGTVGLTKLLVLFLGTSLVGAGASALNQFLERAADARMERTRGRPLPSGRLKPESVLSFGVLTSAAGLALLTFGGSPLAGALAALTLASYLFLYTPLKSRTALCTLVGAVPGALPPLIGWASIMGTLTAEAWLLFSILYLWQLPHFLALAWTYRKDYERAGFKMLPVVDPDGGSTFRQAVLYLLALVPVTLLPATLGIAGWGYFLVALFSGIAFLGCGLATARVRSSAWTRRLFLASVLYLPVILTAFTLEKVIS